MARREYAVEQKHSLKCPAQLSMPAARYVQQNCFTLQSLIMHWHEESVCMQAMETTPNLVCFQVERGQGPQNQKNGITVQLEQGRVLIPHFHQAGFQVRWVQYEVKAAIFHRGAKQNSGHYQAVLWDEDDHLLAEDEQYPCPHQWSHQDERDVSLLWLVPSSEASLTESDEVNNGSQNACDKPRDSRTCKIQHLVASFFD